MRGDDHGDVSCGARGVLYHQGFALLRRLRPERRAVQDPIHWPHGDAVCYSVCSDVGVCHPGGSSPSTVGSLLE
jgi:hypothetical protein